MSIIIDASIALSWYFEDESNSSTDAVLDQVTEHGAFVPSLWKLEVANAFRTAIRRQRIVPAYRDQALTELSALQIRTDEDTDAQAWSETLHLADRFDLTTYDAAYLELAHRRRLPLASLDQDLRRSAFDLGLTVLGR